MLHHPGNRKPRLGYRLMTRTRRLFFLFALAIGCIVACSKPATEKPFAYPFIQELHLQRPAGGDYCQLHLHGAMDEQLLESLQQTEKLHVKKATIETAQPYRQRRSFFFNTFYAQGYRKLVVSLTYGKRLLEKSIYDDKQVVLAF